MTEQEIKQNKLNKYSWILISLLIFAFIGSSLYPSWWRAFIFEGGIFNIRFWLNGFSAIFEYLFFRNSLILIFIVVLILLFWTKKINVKLPQINLFKGFKLLIPIISSVIILTMIWGADSFENEFQNLTKNPDIIKEKESFLNLPVDFYYLNKSRIDNLYSQIQPDLILKEKQLEVQYQKERGVKSGNDILSGEKKENLNQKVTNSYKAEEVPLPKRTTQLLNHFHSKSLINQYETLEFASDDVKKLNDFKSISEQFNIPFNNEKYISVYTRIYGEKLVEEKVKLKQVTGQVLVKGDYIIRFDNNKIVLEHSYIEIDKEHGIKFIITPLSLSDKNLLSSTLTDTSLNGKNLNLSIFGKIVRLEENLNNTHIYIEPYAIW